MVGRIVDAANEAEVANRVKFIAGDLLQADLSEATVVTMYLSTSLMYELEPRMRALKPGTRVVSHAFSMGDWKADETAQVGEPCERWCTALFWIVPAKVEGTWQTGNGTLTLKQQYQELTGTLGSAQIVDGRMRGDEILFTAGGTSYTGRVNGNRMQGSAVANGKTTNWQATKAGR